MKKALNKVGISKIVSVILITSLLLSFTACGAGTSNKQAESPVPATGSDVPPAQAQGKKVINIGITNPPASFSPYTNLEGAQLGISGLLFDSLYKVNDDSNYDPILAESTATTDNKTFIIKLRKNAAWTDGKPLTADDVIYTAHLYANPIVNSAFSQYFGIVAGLNNLGRLDNGVTKIEGIQKIDDYTLSVTTKFPVSLNYFLGNVGSYWRPLPQHVFKDFNPANIASNEFNLKPNVTNGPYKLKSFAVDQYVQLEANENYYLGAPKVKEVNFKIMTAANMAVQLQSGEIDFNAPGIGNLSIDDYDTLSKLPNVNLTVKEASQRQVLEINTLTFKEPKVRQAISLAINRDLLVNQLLKKMGAAIYNPFVPSNKFYNADIKPEYDPAKAKQLLTEANFDFSRQYAFIIPTGNQKREQAGEVIAKNLTELGIKIAIEKYDFATSYQKAREKKYDLFIVSTGPTEDNPIGGLKNLYGTGGSINFSSYSDSRLDALLDQALHEIDNNKQTEIIKQVQAHLKETGSPAVGLYAESQLQAINKRIVNVKVTKVASILTNAHLWDVTK